ncbi:MAG: hypothetical protein KJ709_01730 [Nanoarchaeota archaeon]|nr:hypothetical protein [Nanoarchaeota archaeon]
MNIEKLDLAYDECRESGKFIPADYVDKDLAGSLYKQAKSDWEEVLEFEKAREKKTTNYSKLFSNRYDVMRMLIHALAIFDKIKPSDHKCIGAHLCAKHPEFEFDWETLETMRLLRNGVQYRGQGVTEEVWKSYKLKFEIYAKSLFSFVEKKLKQPS